MGLQASNAEAGSLPSLVASPRRADQHSAKAGGALGGCPRGSFSSEESHDASTTPSRFSPSPTDSAASYEAPSRGQTHGAPVLSSAASCPVPSGYAGAVPCPLSPAESHLLREDGKVMLRFCAPRSSSLADALVLLLVHILPYTPVPIVLLALLWWQLHSAFGWAGTAAFLTGFAYALTSPLVYRREFRERNQHLWMALARYMRDVRVIVPARRVERAGQPHLIIAHPHGRFFYSSVMMAHLHRIWRAPFLPTGDLFACAAAGFFVVPFVRQWQYAVGAIPASRGEIVERLRGGDNVALVVGGVKEVCLGTYPDRDFLYLRNRKGFARIAVEEQYGVIPMYNFNENQLFRHEPKWLLKFWEGVNRVFHMGVPNMRGVLQLPIPFRRELLIVVGEPVYPQVGETVDAFHGRYVAAVEQLFDRYVALSPDPKHKLVIV